MTKLTRRQRKSDGTVSVNGKRFEVPSRFRTMEQLVLRCARWDLSTVDLVDPREKVVLAKLYPLDRTKNADGKRRRVEPLASDTPRPEVAQNGGGEIAPLLEKLMREYAATGLPPAYITKDDSQAPVEQDDDRDSAGSDDGADLPHSPPWDDAPSQDDPDDWPDLDEIPF